MIYVTSSDPETDPDEVISGLEGASGFLRSSLAARIQLRSFPRLRFRWDASHERGMHIEELLDQIKKEELNGGE
jgi:ribosome-binding factor A